MAQVPAWQVQGHEFEPQSHKNNKQTNKQKEQTRKGSMCHFKEHQLSWSITLVFSTDESEQPHHPVWSNFSVQQRCALPAPAPA